jgi:hypothetical protein
MDQPRRLGAEADRVQPYAPYGKACLNCTKSKTRCAVAAVGEKCERYTLDFFSLISTHNTSF